MFITRNLTRSALVGWLGKHLAFLVIFNGVIAVLYAHEIIEFSLPWLPVSIIGTAVAFFVGFKNNQAYERMWEARKIWGGIVNDSRAWGMLVNSFVRKNLDQTNEEILEIKRRLIYRHIAWLYAHRIQLLEPMTWEQSGVSGLTGRIARRYEQNFGLGKVSGDIKLEELKFYLKPNEFENLSTLSNLATQLINQQSLDIIDLHDKEYITQFQHNEMEEVLRTFYELQGRNERIKKFPFPRDYSGMSQFFVWIFIFLFPFSLIPEIMDVSHLAFWISIPVAVLIGLVYIIMEDLGDYHENPFMGTPHAMPMLSLCRTIEIDMREMINDTNIPEGIKPINGVLM